MTWRPLSDPPESEGQYLVKDTKYKEYFFGYLEFYSDGGSDWTIPSRRLDTERGDYERYVWQELPE